MGFLDKAKKMAEQAQAKLDEAQQQFNSSQQAGQGSAPPVEYDKHGRPIAQEAPADGAPPHGDPVAASSVPPPSAAAPPAPPAPPAPADAPVGQGDPLGGAAAAAPPPPAAPPAQPTADAPAEDRNHPSYAPPDLTSGDPLAG
jgi:formin 2/WAS/WASL-interacting protein